MTIIEALEAALADGMFYASNDTRCDMFIENELAGLRGFMAEHEPLDEPGYYYRDGSVYRISPMDGGEDEVYFCQTADEVHAEREAAAL